VVQHAVAAAGPVVDVDGDGAVAAMQQTLT